MRFELCALSALTLGEVRIVPYPEGVPPKMSILVTRVEDGYRAYWNVCQHIPIPLDGGSGVLPPFAELTCLTHGAMYRKTDGLCVEGPCEGAHLEPVRLESSDETLFALI